MADLIKKAPFSPVVTGAALYLLTRAPPSVREPALIRLRGLISTQKIANLITSLKWLFALGVVRNVNSYLSELAGNNFFIQTSKKDWNWDREIAVVTGASSGFGRLFSEDLAARGIHVVALDVNDAPPDMTGNPKITFFKCDVTNHERVMELAKEVQETIGHPSILINNAGVGSGHRILDTSPQWLRKIFDVNLLSHYYTVQAFLPNMLAQKKGHIITIASIASFIAPQGLVDYAATKAGALAFHEGLSAELRAFHKCPEIKTTVVHPGWADTAMVAPYKSTLEHAGQRVMPARLVSDAVVKQILSCRGGQLVISPAATLTSTLRSWPAWLSWIIKRQGEGDDMGIH